ncbi:MAG: hypothetical protein DJ555_00560 [Desulfurococcaceae archaeon]|nr:MAG: hypothetical protein DJ555_00560 [Desulfurococcaceae archaeon]
MVLRKRGYKYVGTRSNIWGCMGYYRAALAFCMAGSIFLTFAFVFAIFIQFSPQSGSGWLASIFVPVVIVVYVLAPWFLGLVSFLLAFLLSVGERSAVLGLLFGYAAALHVIFIVILVIFGGISGLIGVFRSETGMVMLGIPIVVALLLGIAAARRF